MNQEKSTYTKAEITQTLGVQPYIMALWEKQFGIQTNSIQGEPLYSAQDFAKLRSIKELLYEKGYSIDAAKQYLQENPHILETTMIAASPLLFESKKKRDDSRLSESFIHRLIDLQERLLRLRELL